MSPSLRRNEKGSLYAYKKLTNQGTGNMMSRAIHVPTQWGDFLLKSLVGLSWSLYNLLSLAALR